MKREMNRRSDKYGINVFNHEKNNVSGDFLKRGFISKTYKDNPIEKEII